MIKFTDYWLTAWLICLQLGAWSQSTLDVLQYDMETRWTDQATLGTPWDIYPRPQLVRSEWTNLNGMWNYAILDSGQSIPRAYQGKIRVPFAVESALSGVKKIVGLGKELWYHTTIAVAKPKQNERMLLHFGAVDWHATVYLNGQELGEHKGGYTPFSFDITPFLKGRNQQLVVKVWDPSDKGTQPRGKQVAAPQGIWYTPVTGIWQTVWLEKVPQTHVTVIRPKPDLARKLLEIEYTLSLPLTATKIEAIAIAEGEEVGRTTTALQPNQPQGRLVIPFTTIRPWSPADPFLYDLVIRILDQQGRVVDEVKSYVGMRSVGMGKDANGYTCFLLNGAPIFQLGLLDQGWWPDGLYTAPTEDAMRYDLEVTQALGFNMLRKHVKVEPAHFYYLCDQMGILVWQDMPNGNYFQDLRVAHHQQDDASRPVPSAVQFEQELKEMMDFGYPFPSIVSWVPFNEGWGQYDTKRVTDWANHYDPSRWCDAVSGWADRGNGDMIDIHIYPGPGMELPEEKRASVIGEFGGLGLPVENHLWWNKRNWGYLTYREQTTYQQAFQGLIQDLIPLRSWGLAGAIYTQTTDVEGEVNGIMTYDRAVIKLDTAKTRQLLSNLYQDAWNKRVLLPDAEHQPQPWAVSMSKPKGDWMAPEFDDQYWHTWSAPFTSSPNPFVPTGTFWEAEKPLYLRKRFYLTSVPKNLSVKMYTHHSSATLFVNGAEVTLPVSKGGRKRHYSHRVLTEGISHLHPGWNTIAVKVMADNEQATFDFGLYSSQLVVDQRHIQSR